MKGNNSLRGRLKFFVMLTYICRSCIALNIIAVNNLPQSLIVLKIITKKCKIFIKLPIQIHQPNKGLSTLSENFRAGG